MKLLSPKTEVSRPITDRVKESLYSVLYKYDLPKDKTVADVFSGVGSLGLEALSRGAKFVTFVEKDADIKAILERNIEKAGFVEQSKVIRGNAFRAGAPVGIEQGKYDLIFIDPPYARTKDVTADSPLAGLLTIVSEQLAPGGLVVVRTHKGCELMESYGVLEVIERRKWGTMIVTILQVVEK